ncbi:hypothetical protein PA598K_05644 [Paenibacillus sp. 598K]|uniref:AraC family transcriptional regulator n=1 Tax=Paenibacillus sp. 598K TaxID=1117987 RepID=UPI000FF9D8BB|nr:AraC family transcriptional regulator [Paenibacillus sp. 598K]GBF77118.1 hypothetical protein PA598K_05644 [Paenibacillus sp. 598K]
MDWEALAGSWSNATVRLTHIHKRQGDEPLPVRSETDGGFFVLTTGEASELVISDTVHHIRGVYLLHGGPGALMSVRSASSDFRWTVLSYRALASSPTDLERLAQTYSYTPHAALPLQDKCQTVTSLWQGGDALSRLEAQAAFLSFVGEALRQGQTVAEHDSRPDPLSEAVRYIQRHYAEPITVETLTGVCGCSASYLSRLFRQQLGFGPIDYLIDVRIHKAKQQLLRSEARLHEIAASVGYADAYYFSRLFKKHTGCSPMQYRSEQRKAVQNNPLLSFGLSIESVHALSHNENEIYYQWTEEGETSMLGWKKPRIAAMLLLCTTLLLSACQGGSNTGGAANGAANGGASSSESEIESGVAATRTYKHLKGESEIPVKPERVVSLFHLGQLMALDVRPVGATTYVLDNPLLGDLSDIMDVGVPPSAEKILALDPDLIITTVPFMEIVEGGYEALSQIAPTVVVEQLNDPFLDVEMFGELLGKQDEAKAWKTAFEAKIASYKERLAPLVGPDETFSILNVRAKEIFIYGDGNMGGNIIYKLLGFKPPQKVKDEVINGETWQISREVIPDFIGDHLLLAVNEGAEEEMKEVEKLIQHTSAWKSGKVYEIDFDTFLPGDPIAIEKQLDIIADLLTEKK